MEEIISGAPTATTRGAADPKIGRPSTSMQEVTPLFAPSQRPDEPITTGITRGPGAGPEILGMNVPAEKMSDALAKLLPFDTTGEITALYQDSLARGD
jgi:hypothetical protein